MLVAFILGNWDKPVVIGSLWNKQSPIPKGIPEKKNFNKTIKTKGGDQILFSDEDKKQSIEITTPSGLKIGIYDEKSKVSFKTKTIRTASHWMRKMAVFHWMQAKKSDSKSMVQHS